jgi:hypothetical protein
VGLVVHCDITGQVVLEHLSSAFAGAIDRIVTARPATTNDDAFISVSFQFEDNNFDRLIHFVLMGDHRFPRPPRPMHSMTLSV